MVLDIRKRAAALWAERFRSLLSQLTSTKDAGNLRAYILARITEALKPLIQRPLEETIASIYEEHPQLLSPGAKAQGGYEPGDPRLQPTIGAALEEAILAELSGSV